MYCIVLVIAVEWKLEIRFGGMMFSGVFRIWGKLGVVGELEKWYLSNVLPFWLCF